MKVSLAISAVGHAAVLLWGLITFTAKPLDAPPSEPMPVDIMSVSEFTQMQAGAKNAPKTETPKPLVEKVAEPKPVENQNAKVVEKQEIVTASTQVTPPEPKPPEPKKATPAPPEARHEQKPKEPEKKEPPPKNDPIAEALKKDETKKPEPKKAETKAPAPPKKQQTFDPKQIEKRLALLDKRDPQRLAAAGETINSFTGLGTTSGTSVRLSMSELDAFRAKVESCWKLPGGAPNANKLNVLMTIRLKQDGTLASRPEVERSGSDGFARAMNESAVRAVMECQPYTMFSPAKYDLWREIEINFDPKGMFGG